MRGRLRDTMIAEGNVFEPPTEAVRAGSPGQIMNALFEVGGQYRRSV